MEEKKTLKIKKPYLIIFALAIAFAIMGFIDLKVNAAELTAPTISEQYLNYTYVSDVQFTNGNTSYLKDIGSLQANPQVRLGIYVETDDGGALRYCLRYDATLNRETRVSIQRTETYNGSTTTSTRNDLANAVYFYPTSKYTTDTYNVKYTLELDTNIPIFKDITTCINYLNTGVINEDDLYDVPIDYSQLQTDDTMPYVDNIYGNRLCFETLPDYAYYDYFTWKNNTSFQVQVERTPIAHFYKGYQNRNLVKAEYMGFVPYKILDSGTSKLNNVSDVARFHQQYPKEHAWYRSVIDTADYNYDYVKLGFGYRLRYIDISTQKASLWIYIIPTYAVGEVGQGYLKYIQYADGSLSDYMDITGLQKSWNLFDGNKIGSVEDVENSIDKIIQYVDNRNEFKEEFGVGDNVSTLPSAPSGSVGNNNGNVVTDVDVEDATTWLHSVATFIKGTPSFIGSVISFLPEPVRYGMFVCLFLGVIASGYAIVKALI